MECAASSSSSRWPPSSAALRACSQSASCTRTRRPAPSTVAARAVQLKAGTPAPPLAGDALDGSGAARPRGATRAGRWWSTSGPRGAARAAARRRSWSRSRRAHPDVQMLSVNSADLSRGAAVAFAAKSKWTWPSVFDPSGGYPARLGRRRPARDVPGGRRRQAPRPQARRHDRRPSSTSWWRRCDRCAAIELSRGRPGDGVRRRLRLVRVAVRAAARAGVPVVRLRRRLRRPAAEHAPRDDRHRLLRARLHDRVLGVRRRRRLGGLAR